MSDCLPGSNPIEQYIEPGESIVWLGKPQRGPYVRMGTMGLWVMCILIGGFSIAWTVLAFILSAPFHQLPGIQCFWMFGIPFLLVGVGWPIVRSVRLGRLADNTFYAVTKRRIIILAARRLTSLELSGISTMNVVMRGKSAGHIVFGDMPSSVRDFSGPPGKPLYGRESPAFYCVADVNSVYNLIRSMKSQPQVI
jgi:hypothetical protein